MITSLYRAGTEIYQFYIKGDTATQLESVAHISLAFQHLYDLIFATISLRCSWDAILKYFEGEIFDFDPKENTCSRQKAKELL